MQWWTQKKWWMDGLKFPFIKDLVNAGCFVAWIEWPDRKEVEVREQRPPRRAGAADRWPCEASMGAQVGTTASKEAREAMISAEIANDQSYAKVR